MDKTKFIKQMEGKIPARWHMTVICLATVATGILVSKGILYFHLAEPMLRYGFAVLFSYVTFFMLVYLWLRIHFTSPTRVQNGVDALDVVDVADLASALVISEPVDPTWTGSGGQGSGGGASASWGSESGSGSISGDSAPSVDFDEGILVVLLVAVLAAVFTSAGFLIYQAPEILFEAGFETVLAAALIREAKTMKPGGWQVSILKKTWWIFALVLITSMAFGFVIRKQCPEASSFNEYRNLCWSKGEQ